MSSRRNRRAGLSWYRQRGVQEREGGSHKQVCCAPPGTVTPFGGSLLWCEPRHSLIRYCPLLRDNYADNWSSVHTTHITLKTEQEVGMRDKVFPNLDYFSEGHGISVRKGLGNIWDYQFIDGTKCASGWWKFLPRTMWSTGEPILAWWLLPTLDQLLAQQDSSLWKEDIGREAGPEKRRRASCLCCSHSQVI